MSNRFHNKYHRHSHHTVSTGGDIDSARDPIASPSDPFKGDFHISDGNLVLLSGDLILSDGDLDISNGNIVGNDGDFTKINVEIIDSPINTIAISADNITGLPLSKISDIDTTGLVDENVLIYDSGSSSWRVGDSAIGTDSIGTDEIDDNIWGDGISKNGSVVDLDFATSGDVAAVTSEVLVVNPKSLADIVNQLNNIKTDTEYVAVGTIGTPGVAQSSGGPYTYLISNFTGSGLITTEIRALYVRCHTFGINAHDSKILVSTPEAQTVADKVICRSYGENSDDDCGNSVLVTVPINKGQNSVKFAFSGGVTHEYTIIGAIQRIV